jgi:hypothetical protein
MSAIAMIPVAGADRLRALSRSTAAVWLAHLLEMVVAMMVGMAVLGPQVEAIAAALGQPDVHHRVPQVAILLMALEMAVPMALWMNHRGHGHRGVAEMSAVMVLPALAFVGGAAVGWIATPALMSAYHATMYIGMIALMAYRRRDFTAGVGHR